MYKEFLLHSIFGFYVLFGHPQFMRLVGDVQLNTTQHIGIGLVLLALIALEHFAARIKIHALVQGYNSLNLPQKIQGGGPIFLWIVHLLTLMVILGLGLMALFGTTIDKISPLVTLPLMCAIVVKDILGMVTDTKAPEYRAPPKHPEWLADGLLMLFSFFAHSVFWGLIVRDSSSLLSRPMDNSFAATFFIFLLNVSGITLLFLMSYCGSRTLFMAEEFVRSKTEGTWRVILPYFIAVASAVTSVYLAAS